MRRRGLYEENVESGCVRRKEVYMRRMLNPGVCFIRKGMLNRSVRKRRG